MSRSSKTAALATLVAVAGLSAGCNRYMLFNQAGYEQAAFNDEADILFVIDNSGSMSEETAALASNFGSFLEVLTSEAGAAQVTETLTDAVNNYITYTQDRGRFIDYRLAITTATAGDEGNDGIILPGESGRFVGEDRAVVSKDDADVEGSFLQLLLCDTGYWDNPPIGGTGVLESCDSVPPPGEDITREFLDCYCGADGWDNPAGTGQEEHLEAALMAMCRASDDPPDVCYGVENVFADTEEYTNDGFLRDGATAIVVIVTDEGDLSRRIPGAETDPAPYLTALGQFDRTVKIVTIGPHFEPETGNVECGGTGGSGTPPLYTIQRLYEASNVSGGFYSFINEPDVGGDCTNTDFSVPLRELGALLVNLDTAFQLQSIPDVSTIQVWIDGEEVPAADLVSGEAGTLDAVYDSGWSYDPSQNSVSFWGKWIPDFNADVEIFYRPLDGQPRDLPF